MTTANRHVDAPYQDGETLEAADLELDIANVYTVVNGNIDNSNIAAAADIAGSKLLDGGVTAAKITTSTLTLTQMNAAAVPKAYVSTSSAAAVFGVSTAWVDVNSITAATLTAGQSGDYIFVDCMVTYDKSGPASGTADVGITMGFEVAFGTAAATATAVAAQFLDRLDTEPIQTVHFTYAFTATAAEAITVVPQMMGAAGTDKAVNYSTDVPRVFRAQIIPIKS